MAQQLGASPALALFSTEHRQKNTSTSLMALGLRLPPSCGAPRPASEARMCKQCCLSPPRQKALHKQPLLPLLQTASVISTEGKPPHRLTASDSRLQRNDPNNTFQQRKGMHIGHNCHHIYFQRLKGKP